MSARNGSTKHRHHKTPRQHEIRGFFGLSVVVLVFATSILIDGVATQTTTATSSAKPTGLLRITKPAPIITATSITASASLPSTSMTKTTPATPALTTAINSTTIGVTLEESSTFSAPPSSTSSSSSSALAAISTRTPSVLMPHGNVGVASTTVTIAEICISGIGTPKKSDGDETTSTVTETEVGDRIIRHEREFVQTIEGDIMLSVLTTDPASALFVVNRLNEANIIEANFEIGIRSILVDGGVDNAQNLLLREIKYQQQCVSHPIGIFVDDNIYRALAEIIKDLEYNIWPIPTPYKQIFAKTAHLMQQMPWGEQLASVEIRTEDVNIFDGFVDAAKREGMCLMHTRSDDNIYILIGNRMGQHFEENGTVFAVPTERTDQRYIRDLPDRTYVLMETTWELSQKDQTNNNRNIVAIGDAGELNSVLVGQNILPSRFLALARPLLDLMYWLKGEMEKNCHIVDDVLTMENCGNFLAFVGDWGKATRPWRSTVEILDALHMQKYGPEMNYQMLQKILHNISAKVGNDDQDAYDLRKMASQNYVTNVTTFYHYNPNRTSADVKTKFGQVFNCQYSVSDSRRYPFLYDGESVMFWRIKPEAWVATGMTAAILGLIITFAILVFIVVRISLGDVFEGNPVTSILLLLSLVLLFSSFIPFSLEYVGEQRNSHVTFADAATLNTLCAVRIFVFTLVYCFAFSLMLCRAIMLASIGSEGGFLSHVNGYIQAVICGLSILVQLCMSIQTLVMMHIAAEKVACEDLYYGNWLWAIVAYDFILLSSIVGLVPFIYRSQRNYREGILIVIGAVLIFIIWLTWIAVALFGDEMRDAAIPLGLQASGWAILVGVLVPRTFLIVRGIERSDIAQALPSLTSLAFAQNQYASDHSVYECVNPAMRQCSLEDMQHQQYANHHQSPSEIPTLPLRGGGPRRQQFFANLRQANANINPQRPPPRPQRTASPPHSLQSSLPPSPEMNNKITRF